MTTNMLSLVREQLPDLQEVEPNIDEKTSLVIDGDLYINRNKIKKPLGTGFPVSFFIADIGIQIANISGIKNLSELAKLFNANAYLTNHFYATECGATHSCVQFLRIPEKYLSKKSVEPNTEISSPFIQQISDANVLIQKVSNKLEWLVEVKPSMNQWQIFGGTVYANGIEIKTPVPAGFPVSFYVDEQGVKIDGVKSMNNSSRISLIDISKSFNANAFSLSKNSYHESGGEIHSAVQFWNLPKKYLSKR